MTVLAYVPTGWKGPPGTTRHAVNGHDFGPDLSADEKGFDRVPQDSLTTL